MMIWRRATLSGFVLTRDSAILIWGKIIGVAGLIVSGAINPASLGLSDKQSHIVMAFSAAVMTISAQLSTSTLPGKAAADQVTTPEKAGSQ